MRLLPCASAAVVILLSVSCKQEPRRTAVHQNQVEDPHTQTADEWIARFKTRIEGGHADFNNLYAELPPEAEWPAILAVIRDNPLTDDPHARNRYKLFGELLAGNTRSAGELLHPLLTNAPVPDGYSHGRSDDAEYYLALTSNDEKAKSWLKKRQLTLPDYGATPPPADTRRVPEENTEAFIASLWAVADGEDTEERIPAIRKLLLIGDVLEKPDLKENALRRFKEEATNPASGQVRNWHYEAFIDELARRDDWPSIRSISPRRTGMSYGAGSPRNPFLAFELTSIRHLEGPRAFLDALAALPKYGIGEIGAYLTFLTDNSTDGRIFGEEVVIALVETGETDAAGSTLWNLLALKGGDDSLYRLAIRYFPAESPAYFESLRRYHRYEERPLIWLAELALQNGQPDAARELIDQAIALDPSDGEQGKRTRMQAYDVLSRILLAKGENEQAGAVTKILSAIRSGEAADTLLEVGLIGEAIRRYQEALERFNDAYCLQSRLAITLQRAGKSEEAKLHFRKAFELMPDSFGPMESHCLGCEGIFKDKGTQSLAMESFRNTIRNSPGNPRTHYLLGLVMIERNRPDAAITCFRKALELDPNYYNCAIKLHQLLWENPKTAREAAELIPKIVAIAPYQNIAGHFRDRMDVAQTWRDAQQYATNPLNPPAVRLPFVAPASGEARSAWRSGGMDSLDGWSPDELLRNNSLMYWISAL